MPKTTRLGQSLPLPEGHTNEDAFLASLLKFSTECDLFQVLCGGVHILDFLVREPDLYASVLPNDWRNWLQGVDILDLLDLLIRENIRDVLLCKENNSKLEEPRWRSYSLPPWSLLEYVSSVRTFLLDRSFHDQNSRPRNSRVKPLSRHLAIGMKDKKVHEVEHFSAFISDFVRDLAEKTQYRITDVVDFGAGQGYLGRSLASPLYRMNVVSVESKSHNITGAMKNDVLAKVSKQEVVYRDKKLYRAGVNVTEIQQLRMHQIAVSKAKSLGNPEVNKVPIDFSKCGMIRHIEHKIISGDLDPVVEKLELAKQSSQDMTHSKMQDTQLLVVSLHSCGNLLHHGVRSLVLNDSVKAVAMIGCCYNLVTERLGAPTYKLPNLRTKSKRLEETSNARDQDGFPMSERFATYHHKANTGIRLNITARMMAVQAPRNWTRDDCDSFFTRHFYRALLQRIFLDHNIIEPINMPGTENATTAHELSGGGDPITIGTLSKNCFKSFPAYVRGALKKLVKEEERGPRFRKLGDDLTDNEIRTYEERYRHRRHDLCVLWSFMAFSAGVVETLIVTDRWQWLREQEEVSECWIQTVFDYKQSPRNLVVVGVKR